MPKGARDEPPTLNDYFLAAHNLAKVVKQTLAQPGSVKRKDVVKALRAFERVDYKAM